MEYRNYEDLGIVSSKKPQNTHLIVETNGSGVLYAVDSADNTNLVKTTDKGENWNTVANRGKIIRALWHDRTGGFIYAIEDDRGNDDVTVWKIDLSDDTVSAIGADIGDALYDAFDISIRNSELEVFMYDTDTDRLEVYRWNDPNWDLITFGIVTSNDIRWSYIVVVGTTTYFWISGQNAALDWIGQIVIFNGTTFATSPGENDVSYPASFNQNGLAYDGSNILFFVWEDIDDNENYLFTYNISGNSLSQGGKYNIALMLDRNTVSGIKEKAFHLSEDEIYQLHSTIPYQIYLISNVSTDAVWIAITDNFVMNDDGDMFEYIDVESSVQECIIDYEDMNAPSAIMSLINTVTIEKGMFISITDMFTTATVSANAVIFEGFVGSFTERYIQKVSLISPALKDLDEEFPSGDYSGRTDEIIVSLLADYADYITAGTMANGLAMGTITFAGDKSLRVILDEFAMTDKFIWYLTPMGVLLYNAGTVDSGENFTETSPIWDVTKIFEKRAINYVNVKGAFVSGAQVSGTIAQDQTDQQIYGRIPFERTFSHLDLAAQCTTTNTNVLSRLGVQPLIVPFSHKDVNVGVIQTGETVTFQYNLIDPNISSDQFGIRSIRYDAKQGKAHYRISDVII